jgi:hypothetical protein
MDVEQLRVRWAEYVRPIFWRCCIPQGYSPWMNYDNSSWGESWGIYFDAAKAGRFSKKMKDRFRRDNEGDFDV